MDTTLKAIRSIYANGVEQNHESAEQLVVLCNAIDKLQAEQTIDAKTFQIVECYFEKTLLAATNNLARSLTRALVSVSNRLQWQLANFELAPEFSIMKTNYAFTAIAAPQSWTCSNYHSDDVLFGLTIQAPHTFYAGHAHKAREIYYVISGKSQWKRGDEDWQDRSSGSLIFHDHHVSHAMQTFDEPLLSLFAWPGDLDSEVVSVSNDY